VGERMKVMFGSSIGKKFWEDGTVRRYPGNTVVADVTPGCPAYDVMTHLRQMVVDAGFDRELVLLPEDSYHMTVFRGLNDQVRVDSHWPARLPKDTPMVGVDDYVSAAVANAGIPGPARMRFDKVGWGNNCCIICLVPADEEQARILKEFRDRAADAVGLRLPGHDAYVFHISLGYAWVIPEGERETERLALVEAMNRYIANRPAFETGAPYMAYYDDMLEFSPVRIPRD